MIIWLDGDACPKAIKEILFRAANRTRISMVVVANSFIPLPASPYIKRVVVPGGFDVADQEIVDRLAPGDLVITADIPLADAVISKGGYALNPRGELYTAANIKQCLTMRNFNESLRGSGVLTGGPAALDNRCVQSFANQLDKFIQSQNKK